MMFSIFVFISQYERLWYPCVSVLRPVICQLGTPAFIFWINHLQWNPDEVGIAWWWWWWGNTEHRGKVDVCVTWDLAQVLSPGVGVPAVRWADHPSGGRSRCHNRQYNVLTAARHHNIHIAIRYAALYTYMYGMCTSQVLRKCNLTLPAQTKHCSWHY